MSKTNRRSGSLPDTQALILSAAAARDDRALVRPETMAAVPFTRAAKQLLQQGLIEETAADNNQPRRATSHAGRPMTLRITAAGLKAIGIEPESSAQGARQQRRSARQRKPDVRENSSQHAPEPAAPPARVEAAPYRPGTKRALIVTLLSREQGASLEELIAATGWLPHTTRAALTGLRRKGYHLTRTSSPAGSTYRVDTSDEVVC